MKSSVAGAVLLGLLVTTGRAAEIQAPKDSKPLVLHLQSRTAGEEPGDPFEVVTKTVSWDPAKTAVIVCDMWARHWCEGACRRGAEMAPRMNEFLNKARQRGALIVHAPSGGMEHYKDHPARLRAQQAPKAAKVPEKMGAWCRHIKSEDGAEWPIDQADGGCDDQPTCPQREMDRRQTAALEIRGEDAITDSGEECWNLFEARGIENVILVGVHTNMCVIGRPFGLRNMVRVGKNVALVRDLTDTMYNSRSEPKVSHVCGTDKVVEYIEKYVCATITSSQLLGGPTFRFAEDKRPNVVLIAWEDEYGAARSLPVLADLLRDQYGCRTCMLAGEEGHGLADLDELEAADLMVLFVRRKAPPAEQLAKIRKYLDAGGPLVAMRTASHAFSLRNKPSPEGCAQWPEFDADVLGGNYHNHGSNKLGTDVSNVPEAADNPILAGVTPARWHSTGSLYFTSPIDPKATLLMRGKLEETVEPLTWTRSYKGGRVFYTSLGHRDDFKLPQFRRLLANAAFWAMDRLVPEAGK